MMQTVLERRRGIAHTSAARSRTADRFGTEASRSVSIAQNDETAQTKHDGREKSVGSKAKRGLFSTFAVALAIFAVFAFTVYRYQRVFAAESELNELKSQISTIEEQNERLKTQIAVSEDIEMIRERASSELDMYFPDDGQTANVDLVEAPAPEIEVAAESVERSDALDIMAVIKSIFS